MSTAEERAAALRRDVAFRALHDAWLEGSARYWERRARDFEWVLTGDRATRPTPEQLASNPSVAATIAACRARGALRDISLVELGETLIDLAGGVAA